MQAVRTRPRHFEVSIRSTSITRASASSGSTGPTTPTSSCASAPARDSTEPCSTLARASRSQGPPFRLAVAATEPLTRRAPGIVPAKTRMPGALHRHVYLHERLQRVNGVLYLPYRSQGCVPAVQPSRVGPHRLLPHGLDAPAAVNRIRRAFRPTP